MLRGDARILGHPLSGRNERFRSKYSLTDPEACLQDAETAVLTGKFSDKAMQSGAAGLTDDLPSRSRKAVIYLLGSIRKITGSFESAADHTGARFGFYRRSSLFNSRRLG